MAVLVQWVRSCWTERQFSSVRSQQKNAWYSTERSSQVFSTRRRHRIFYRRCLGSPHRDLSLQTQCRDQGFLPCRPASHVAIAHRPKAVGAAEQGRLQNKEGKRLTQNK